MCMYVCMYVCAAVGGKSEVDPTYIYSLLLKLHPQ